MTLVPGLTVIYSLVLQASLAYHFVTGCLLSLGVSVVNTYSNIVSIPSCITIMIARLACSMRGHCKTVIATDTVYVYG